MSNTTVTPAPAFKPVLDPVHILIGLAGVIIPPALAYLSNLDWSALGPVAVLMIPGALQIIREVATTELAGR